MQGRLLGLDYGDRTIGVAVSDPLGLMALGLETIRRSDEKTLTQSFARLAQLVADYNVSALVLGYPKNMDNTEGERCQKTLEFKQKLEKRLKVPVVLWDERLSTQGAMRTLSATGKKGKSVVDEMAAVFILQGYMDKASKNKVKKPERVRLNMTEFDDFDLDAVDAAITMVDGEGNEIHYQVLATKKNDKDVYMLAEEVIFAESGEESNEESEEELVAEVLMFKCTDASSSDSASSEAEEMVFEMLDENSPDFDKAFEMFKDVFDELGVEY